MDIFKLLDYGIVVYVVVHILRTLSYIYKPHTPFAKIPGNISSMNRCRKCGRPMTTTCWHCAVPAPETLLGATPVIAMRVFRVNLNTLTLHSLNSGRANLGGSMGEAWIPGETKTAKCAVHDRRNRIRFVNSYYGDIEIPRAEVHDAPVWGCTCGVWSCKSREALAKTVPVPSVGRAVYLQNKQNIGKSIAKYEKYSLLISAQVYQWGRIVEHEWGYRSQHARIIPESIQIYPRNIKTARDKKLVETLRRKYSNG